MGGGGPPGGVSHTLPPASSSIYGSHPHAFVCPHFHQRGCSRGGHPGVDCQGCCGACSSSLARLLRPPVCGLDDRGVVASGHRPVPAQSLRGHFALSHGDHLVSSYVSPAGGLDGLHRSLGGVSSGSCASGILALPTLCGSWPRLPIHSVVLRSVHGPAGLHSGYDSCIRCSSFLGYPYASFPGRLARPDIVPGGPPPGSRGCLVPLSRVGSHLVPGGRLRMSSLQICLHRSWDQLDPSAPVPWSLDCLRDLRWWLRGDRFSRGVSLLQVSPVLEFWSGTSDVG